MVNAKLLSKVILFYKMNKLRKRKKRSMYIRPIFIRRNVQGDSKLVQELKMDPEYHRRYFRMTKDNFDWIFEKVRAKISHRKNHLRPIPAVDRLSLTLRFLASGNSQISLALSYRISPSSVTMILRETLSAICEELESEFLPKPTEETWKNNVDGFGKRWNMPNCTGALDGKHVRIKSPKHSGSSYFNYKGFFSIVLMAIVDQNYQFTVVDIGSQGSSSDGGIFSRCSFGKKVANETIGFPEPSEVGGKKIPNFLVADDALPLKTNIMKPYGGKWLSLEEKIYNYRISRARLVVENAFGILAGRWRILLQSIDGDVELVKLLVKTCIILHNFLTSKSDFSTIIASDGQEFQQNEEVQVECNLERISRQGSNNFAQDAGEMRNHLKSYFNSNEGSVSWQLERVQKGYE